MSDYGHSLDRTPIPAVPVHGECTAPAVAEKESRQ
jgi:hypothetical protein